MKIAVTRLGDCLIADGINLFIYELSDALINLGHEVYLVSSLAENVPWGGNVQLFEKAVREMFSVKNVPFPYGLGYSTHGKSFAFRYMEQNLLFTLKGPKIFKEISPDFVIFNGASTTFCPFFKIVVAHDLQFRIKISKYYDSLAYRAFNEIATTSTELKDELIRQLHLPPAKIKTIPICIDTAKFSPQPMSERIHAILHIGPRMEKRPDITVDAFEKIARHDAEIKLFIAGQFGPKDAPLLSRIKRIKKSIRERIIILGRVSKEKLSDLYSHVKVTCVPSDYVVPVCSPTVVESLAAGTPVVGSLSAISKDILIDGYDGFRVQPNNVEMFASRIDLLIKDNDLWSKASRNSLEVAKRCDKKNVALNYLSLYKKS